ncbi:MAG: serine/threonine protein kinase [Kofleriaceae bacterium]|nr:serine/threonine protein kinase [Kofleriaceae bacterium]
MSKPEPPPAAPPIDPDHPSQIGRYQVLRRLATGGMGELFVAQRAGAGTDFAGFRRLAVLKRLRPELGQSSSLRQMLADEAALAARLGHPNVCEVHDLEVDREEVYLAMPYLDGVALGEVLAGWSGPADLARTRLLVGILTQACAGLHHAHELRGDDGAPLGVVHRDVSPGNLLVTTEGVVKVLDFGIAKVPGQSSVTEQGMVKGKLAYMAPEQLAGGALDRRADVFALAVLAWEGLVGRPLFARGSASLTAAAVLDEPIARVDALAPAVPTALADVVARALARPPVHRPASAAALQAALEVALADHGGPATAPELARWLAAQHGAMLAARRAELAAASAAATGAAVVAPPVGVTVAPAVVAAATATPVTAGARRWAPWIAIAGLAAAAAAGWAAAAARSPSSASSSVAAAAADAGAPAIRLDADDLAVAAPTTDAAPTAAAVDAAPVADPVAGTPARGRVSIDSTPWAELFIDGRRVGVTPFIDKPLTPGRHRVRAVLADGRARTFSVDVRAGRAAPPVVLTW